MKSKTIILSQLLYFLLVAPIGASENVLESIKNKGREIRGVNSQANVFQATDAQNVKRAISHENAGLKDQAYLIFEQIFLEKKSSSYIFSNYKNFLIRQEDWSLLIDISREYAELNQNNDNASLALAESILYVSSKDSLFAELESEGYLIIDRLILNNLNEINEPINTSRIKRYISRLIHYNKYDFAIDKIENIRIEYGYPSFYSRELGKYYLSNRDYKKSINEYLLSLTNEEELNKYLNNQYGSIQSQLAQFPDDDDTKSIIINELLQHPNKIKNNILAQYRFKWGEYDQACTIMLSNFFTEKHLYDFAINIMRETDYNSAARIFKFLISSSKGEIAELSILQLATILEMKSIKQKIYLPISDRIINNSFLELPLLGSNNIDYKSEELSQAIMMYDSLITKYNNSKAKYKVAEFKAMTNIDYKKTLSDFTNLEESATDRNIKFKSAIKIIEIYIENGLVNEDLMDRIEKYKKRYTKKSQNDQLNLKRFQTLFFLKKYDQLQKELSEQLKSIDKDNSYYNEYLDGITTMMLFNNNNDDLSIFCDGLLEIKKQNYTDAIDKFNLLSESNLDMVANICSYYLGYIYINLQDYEKAQESLSLNANHDIFSELSLLLSAELEDYVIKDINSAVDRYMDFIGNYDYSIFYEEIRIRLEEIIG